MTSYKLSILTALASLVASVLGWVVLAYFMTVLEVGNAATGLFWIGMLFVLPCGLALLACKWRNRAGAVTAALVALAYLPVTVWAAFWMTDVEGTRILFGLLFLPAATLVTAAAVIRWFVLFLETPDRVWLLR
jgi:hypothetical protein